MNTSERTSDIYEQLPHYPKPPLIPLPKLEDPATLALMGVQPGGQGLFRKMLSLTGFTRWYQQLPDQLEPLLRKTNLRVPGIFAPAISATLVLQDDGRGPDPFQRAATLVLGAYDLYNSLQNGDLPPDRHRDQPLEMGQYPNLFATHLEPVPPLTRVYKSSRLNQITVIASRRFFLLDVGGPGSLPSVEQFAEALRALARAAAAARRKNGSPSPAILTSSQTSLHMNGFKMLRRMPVNARSLEALRESFLTLCLDLETEPASLAQAAHMAHSGNFNNRWYHASLQLVVFGNSRAAAICNFTTYLDGNTMMRGAAEIQKRAGAQALEASPGAPSRRLPAPVELEWRMPPKLYFQAQRQLRLFTDNQPATFTLPGFGRNFFQEYGLDPVPTFVAALQLAARCVAAGPMPSIVQFLALSKFRCMDLTTAGVTTPEMVEFVNYMESPWADRQKGRELFQAAVQSQDQACRKKRQALGLDVLLSLYAQTRPRRLQRRLIGGLRMLTYGVLGRLGHFKPDKRDILISHPEIYAEIPVVGRPGIRLPYVRCFALHYQIWPDEIVVTFMPSTIWQVPNAEIAAELQRSLQRIQELVC